PEPETWSVTPSSTSVLENAGFIDFFVTRSTATTDETIYASTIQTLGSTNNGDYHDLGITTGLLDHPVFFPAGTSTEAVRVFVTNDAVPETPPTETFGFIVQASATGEHVLEPTLPGTSIATFTIIDDDSPIPTPQFLSPLLLQGFWVA